MFEIHCAVCEFHTVSPADMVAHMVESGHGMAADLREDIKDSKLFAEFANAIEVAASGQPPPAGMEISPVDPDDDDIPEELRDAMLKFHRQHAGSDLIPLFGAEHSQKPFDVIVYGFRKQKRVRVDLHHRDVPVPCQTREIDLSDGSDIIWGDIAGEGRARDALMRRVEAVFGEMVQAEESKVPR